MVISHTAQRDGIDQNARASYQTKARSSHVYRLYLVVLREILRFDRGLVMNRHVIHEQPLVELAYGMYRQNVLPPKYPLYIRHPRAMTPLKWYRDILIPPSQQRNLLPDRDDVLPLLYFLLLLEALEASVASQELMRLP
jgi:hypothetical protein